MSDVWNQTSHIRCLIWDMWHQITVILQQKSDIRRLTSHNFYQKTDVWCHIRRLISDTSCCHQTSDNSYITYNIRCLMSFVSYRKSDVISDVWYQTPDDVLSYNCYQTSDVICYVITVIRRLMSMMFVFWYQMSHVRCLISDLWYDIRYLITVIWQQLSDVRHLLSEVWCYITVISCLMSDIRRLIWWTSYQTSDNSYMTAHICYQTSNV